MIKQLINPENTNCVDNIFILCKLKDRQAKHVDPVLLVKAINAREESIPEEKVICYGNK